MSRNLLVQTQMCCSQNQNSWCNWVSNECTGQDRHIHPTAQCRACLHISSQEGQFEFLHSETMHNTMCIFCRFKNLTFIYHKVFPCANVGCDVFPRLGDQNVHRLDVGSMTRSFVQNYRCFGDEQLIINDNKFIKT